MLLAFLIAVLILSPWIAWETHRYFSRAAFWWFTGAVIAVNAILFGAGLYLALQFVDIPGLVFAGPFYIIFSPPPRFFAIAGPPVILAVSALTWGYIGGRIVGARAARRAKLMQGLCSACGYNLTGNTSGICPECGTKVSITSAGLNR